MTQRHQYEMGIVGNCNYLAYVGTDADVRWLCWPRMDSSFVFGSILDSQKGGHFRIGPSSPEEYESKQYYIDNTNVLVTEFFNKDHHFKVVDFAPRFELFERFFKPLMFMRKVELIKGKPEISVSCDPVYDYGEKDFKSSRGSNHIDFQVGEEEMRLTTNSPINYLLEKRNYHLTKDLYFCLTWNSHLEAPLEATYEEFLKKTIRYWQTWVRRTAIPQQYQDEVIRSALVLKLHQYEDTGAIIASGTSSLPEHDQSGRNWDYRYCWPRDSYYTLNAFHLICHFSELEEYAHFMQNLITHERHVQPVFGISGEEKLIEKELPLEGYLKNQPVRVGNEAYTQVQYDIYGQILHSLSPLYFDKRLTAIRKAPGIDIIHSLTQKIEQCIDLPDAGIWEFRNRQHHHLHTKLFHWLGCKVVMKIAKLYGEDDLYKKAESLKERAVEYIEDCYDEGKGYYKASTDYDYVDASTLLIVNLNYLTPNSERARKHVDRVYQELKSENGFLYRYKEADDFGETKSSFLVCTFWYIEALIKTGRLEEAQEKLQEVCKASNHLGLFSEDVQGNELSQWGNFPQTYSHVGFIHCAFKLERYLDRHNFEI